MKMNATSFLLGGTLLCQAFPHAFAAPTAGAGAAHGGSPMMASGVALTVHAMISAPAPGYDVDFLNRVAETMPVHGDNGVALSRADIERDVSVQKSADPLIAALHQVFPDIEDSPTPAQILAAFPAARRIVAQREDILRQNLPNAQIPIAGDVEAVYAQRNRFASLALDLMLYNSAYMPRERRDDLWTLNSDWSRVERLAREAREQARSARTAQAIASTAEALDTRSESAEPAAFVSASAGNSNVRTGLRPPVMSANGEKEGNGAPAASVGLQAALETHSGGVFPLDHIRRQFLQPLKLAVANGDDAQFQRLTRQAFAELEIQTFDVLAALPRSPQDAPRRIDVAARLASDVASLEAYILGIDGVDVGRMRKSLSGIRSKLIAKINTHNPGFLADAMAKRQDSSPQQAADYLVGYVALWKSWLQNSYGLENYLIDGDHRRSIPSLNELSWAHNKISERLNAVLLVASVVAVLSSIGVYGLISVTPVVLKHASSPMWLLVELPVLVLALWGLAYAVSNFFKAWDLYQAGRWINETLARLKG